MAILAPSLAAAKAMAKPIPLEAPVITKVFPFKLPSFLKSKVLARLITHP